MRAIVIEKFGGPDSLVFKEIPNPEPRPGHVVIQFKAFGINHAEMHMRRGEWAEAAPVSGIECVGLVKSCPGGEFPRRKVAALMGGLGRTHQRKLRRVHPRSRHQRRLDRRRPALGGSRCAPGNLRNRLDLPVPQPRDHPRPNPRDSRCDLVVRPGRREARGECRAEGHRHDPQPRSLRDA